MNNSKYEKLCKTTETDIQVRLNPEIHSNTRQAIMYMDKHMNYLKHIYNVVPTIDRYDNIMSYINKNFDDVNESAIRRILIRSLIFPKSYYNIFVFIVASGISLLISNNIIDLNNSGPEYFVQDLLLMLLINTAVYIPLFFVISLFFEKTKFRLYRLRGLTNDKQ